MLNWKDAKQSKPKQGDRVLLKIADENCPVVGYWGAGEWEACTVNLEVSCGSFCQGGSAVGNFRSDEVTHFAEIGDLPEPPEETGAEW